VEETLTEPVDPASPRHAEAQRHGLTDLSPVPERIRALANFWGGYSSGSRAIYALAQHGGLIQSTEELRSEIRGVHDAKARDELLTWLDSRT
jgi:hypothetical protein